MVEGTTFVSEKVMRDKNLNCRSKRIFAILCYLHQHEDIKNQKEKIKEIMQRSDKTIQKYLKELCDFGYIEKCKYKEGSKTKSYYDIVEEYKYHEEKE